MPHRISRRARLTITLTTTAVLLLGGAYTAAIALAPVSATTVSLSPALNTSHELSSAAAEAAVAQQALPTAIGYAGLDAVWSNDDTAYPLASISKLVTMLVALESAPLSPDQSTWPTYTWTERDWRQQQEYIADLGVAFPLEVGHEIALSDMFTLIFLPSANDMVSAYATHVFGTNERFVAAVTDWADRHGFDSLHLSEPSGMSEENVASAADILRIGRLALEDPIITQFITLTDAYVDGVGYVENTNPLLGVEPDILGIKTGRSLSAGFNLLVAQERVIAGREIAQLSVTLGRGSIAERASSGREMLAVLDGLPEIVTVHKAGDPVGTLLTADGQLIELVVAETSDPVVLLPGEHLLSSVQVSPPQQWQAGEQLGEFVIETPSGSQQFGVTATESYTDPGFWWRFTHPRAVLLRESVV